PAREPESPDPRRLAEALGAFWSRANGFTADMRLEGLTSLGLGFLTGIPEVESRCRESVTRKLPAWEQDTARLRRRVSQWLARLEEMQRELALAQTHPERERASERLSQIEERLARLRVRLTRQPARLRPRAAEVQDALAGFVASVGNTRFRRVAREIALMEDRVRTGSRAVRQAPTGQLSSEVLQLAADVEKHLESQPLSPRAHGLSEAERAERGQAVVEWRARAETLLGRIRGHYRLSFTFPQAGRADPALLHWLADSEDLYEFGFLRRKGVFAAFGRRHGWRLEHLLRSS
ncbi:MAG TPA: hypothetical protein VKE94_20485, partial [Gemmataceae bacterium]|nr:hypothetical protein [Gemmataceae bacterium]